MDYFGLHVRGTEDHAGCLAPRIHQHDVDGEGEAAVFHVVNQRGSRCLLILLVRLEAQRHH